MTIGRTRIKICGIREPSHARLAAEAGADAIGVVFHPASPRFVTPAQAAAVAAVPLGLLQFHGDEPPEFCEQFGVPYVRAVRMGEGTDLIEYAGRFKRARALLVDAHVPGQPGGTGRSFDWSLIPRELSIPIILSGGLDVANVGRAVREVKPWAVDVSSGVETGRGSKDPAKIVEFIRSVNREDASR